jgi:hypothetical protein
MSTITKLITLTQADVDSGPNYQVFASSDGSNYTSITTVTLATVSSTATVSVPTETTHIKLVNVNSACSNEVIKVITPPTTTTTTAAPTTTTTTAAPTTTTTTAAPTTTTTTLAPTTTTTTLAPTTTTTTLAPTTTTTTLAPTTTTTTLAPTTTTTTAAPTTTTTTAAPTTTTTTAEPPEAVIVLAYTDDNDCTIGEAEEEVGRVIVIHKNAALGIDNSSKFELVGTEYWFKCTELLQDTSSRLTLSDVEGETSTYTRIGSVEATGTILVDDTTVLVKCSTGGVESGVLTLEIADTLVSTQECSVPATTTTTTAATTTTTTIIPE